MSALVVIPTNADITPDETFEIHVSWWGNCRSCKNWNPPLIVEFGRLTKPNVGEGAKCESDSSPLSGEVTMSSGHCRWWDAFDVDAAIKVMELP